MALMWGLSKNLEKASENPFHPVVSTHLPDINIISIFIYYIYLFIYTYNYIYTHIFIYIYIYVAGTFGVYFVPYVSECRMQSGMFV